MVCAQLWVLEGAPACTLVCLWGCSSALAQGPGLGCLRKMGLSPCSQTLVTKNRARGCLHCLLYMEGECVLSKGDGGSRGAEQQRLPAQALAGSLGSPSSCTVAWMGSRAGRGAGLAMFTWAGEPCSQLPCGHPSVPWRVCGTRESLICRHDEVPAK